MTHHVTLQTGLIIICLSVPALGYVIHLMCEHERKKPLPRPHKDERDWQGAFMRDVKDYGRG